MTVVYSVETTGARTKCNDTAKIHLAITRALTETTENYTRSTLQEEGAQRYQMTQV